MGSLLPTSLAAAAPQHAAVTVFVSDLFNAFYWLILALLWLAVVGSTLYGAMVVFRGVRLNPLKAAAVFVLPIAIVSLIMDLFTANWLVASLIGTAVGAVFLLLTGEEERRQSPEHPRVSGPQRQRPPGQRLQAPRAPGQRPPRRPAQRPSARSPQARSPQARSLQAQRPPTGNGPAREPERRDAPVRAGVAGSGQPSGD